MGTFEGAVLGAEDGFIDLVPVEEGPAEDCILGIEGEAEAVTEGTGLATVVDSYPDGFRQFGAFGCKHCLLLQVAPGSQQSNAELQLLPLFAMQPVEELRYVDESGMH